MPLNPYQSPETKSPEMTLAAKSWTATRLWIVMCGICWIFAGTYWASLELIFTVVLAIPLWLCLAATFFRINITRSSRFGGPSAIATSTAALAIWLGFCEFVRTGPNFPAHGPVGDGLVMLLIIISSLIVLPFVAWIFSSPIESEIDKSKN